MEKRTRKLPKRRKPLREFTPRPDEVQKIQAVRELVAMTHYSPAAHMSTDLVRMAYERGLSPQQFADLAKRMEGDKAKILTVLRGL